MPLNRKCSPVFQVDPDQEISGSGVFPALQHDQEDAIVQDIVPSVTAETLKVAISTPADFKDVYYEIATIRSPYSFQVKKNFQGIFCVPYFF